MGAEEQLRQHYLDAIGITTWLPRAALPGAAASPEWVLSGSALALEADDEGFEPAFVEDDSSIESANSVAVPANAETPRARPAALAALKEDHAEKAPSRPVPAGQAEVVSPVRRPATDAVAPPRFKLAFIVAGETLLVDSLPPQSKDGFSRAHQRLAAGILRALGEGEEASAPALLSWPMLASQSLDQGPAQAALAVQRKLELTRASRPLKRALILGGAAARWVLEREEAVEQLRGLKFTMAGGASCIVGDSLTQMLHLPQEKAQLWRDMRPLLLAAHG